MFLHVQWVHLRAPNRADDWCAQWQAGDTVERLKGERSVHSAAVHFSSKVWIQFCKCRGRVCLTDKVFPEPVWAMPTMSLPLRARGKPWAWMAVGSLKFCCIRTSITYSRRTGRTNILVYSVTTDLVYLSYLQRFTYGDTVPDENWWWALGSQSLELWFLSSCDTLQHHTENKRQELSFSNQHRLKIRAQCYITLEFLFQFPKLMFTCMRWSDSRLPGSFAALLDAHCKSSSQIWGGRPGPISSFVNGPRDFRIFYPVVGRFCWTQNEGCYDISRHSVCLLCVRQFSDLVYDYYCIISAMTVNCNNRIKACYNDSDTNGSG